MEVLMKQFLLITASLFMFCLSPADNNDISGYNPFCLKFINDGSYNITALYLKHVSDTANWGESVLPVTVLKNLEYVLINDIPSGSDYAFKTVFDSAGTSVSLVYSPMSTGAPDTITAHAALAPSSFGHGYNWGLQNWDGEINVTP
jgi:hypothetical protein